MYIIILGKWRCDHHSHIDAYEKADNAYDQAEGRCDDDPCTMMGGVGVHDRSMLAGWNNSISIAGRCCHSR